MKNPPPMASQASATVKSEAGQDLSVAPDADTLEPETKASKAWNFKRLRIDDVGEEVLTKLTVTDTDLTVAETTSWVLCKIVTVGEDMVAHVIIKADGEEKAVPLDELRPVEKQQKKADS